MPIPRLGGGRAFSMASSPDREQPEAWGLLGFAGTTQRANIPARLREVYRLDGCEVGGAKFDVAIEDHMLSATGVFILVCPGHPGRWDVTFAPQ